MKVPTVPDSLRNQLTENHIKNLKEWIDILTKPFANKGYAENCYHIASVLHQGSEDLLPYEETDLLRIDFPTTIRALYLYDLEDQKDEGCVVFSIDNRAWMSFQTDNHSIEKYKHLKMFANEYRMVKGTYNQIAKIYFKYLSDLMSIPKP